MDRNVRGRTLEDRIWLTMIPGNKIQLICIARVQNEKNFILSS